MKSQGAAKNAANNEAQSVAPTQTAAASAPALDLSKVKIEACEAVPKSKKLLKFTLNDGSDRKRTILSGIHEYYEPEELVGKTAIAITNLPLRKMMGIDSEGMLISAVYEYDGHEGLDLLMVDDQIPAGAKLY